MNQPLFIEDSKYAQVFGPLIETAHERGPVLTPNQVGRLSGIWANDQFSKVIGWSTLYKGPVVRLVTGQHVAIKPTGQKTKLTFGPR